MIIVIEGVDRTGKSTLAQELAVLSRGAYMHFGPPEGKALLEYGRVIDQYRPGHDLILDRFHWGECVYGPVYRGAGLSGEEFQYLEELLAKRGAITVVTSGEPHRIAERIKAEAAPGDKFFVQPDPGHLERLQRHFFRLIPLARTHVLRHDIDYGPQLRACDVLGFARYHEEKAAWK